LFPRATSFFRAPAPPVASRLRDAVLRSDDSPAFFRQRAPASRETSRPRALLRSVCPPSFGRRRSAESTYTETDSPCATPGRDGAARLQARNPNAATGRPERCRRPRCTLSLASRWQETWPSKCPPAPSTLTSPTSMSLSASATASSLQPAFSRYALCLLPLGRTRPSEHLSLRPPTPQYVSDDEDDRRRGRGRKTSARTRGHT